MLTSNSNYYKKQFIHFTERAILVQFAKNASKMLRLMASLRLVNIAILLQHLLAANVKDVRIRRNDMAHLLRVNSANRSVPSIDKMKIRR